MAKTNDAVSHLIEAATADTIYRDVYLRRARDLFSPTLDELGYRAIELMQKEVDEVVRHTRSAVVQFDWKKAVELSGQVDRMRKAIEAQAGIARLAQQVYDADVVAFDPFSPGKHLGAHAQATQAGVCTQLLETLASLGKMDTPFTAFYEQRRDYFSGLELGGDSEKTHLRSRRELEQRALEAAERGDIATIESVGRELRDYKDENEKNSASVLLSKVVTSALRI